MKNQDIQINGKLKKIESLKEFKEIKNHADWKLNLRLDTVERDTLSMIHNTMDQDQFQ